jgi:predicted transposase YdaD
MHTDPLLYRLFQERPALLFDLAGLAVAEAAAYRLEATEVKQTAFRLDGVLIPPLDAADAPLVFSEAQFQTRPTFYARWLASIFLYLYRHRVTQPWQAVVVFPDRATDPGMTLPYQSLTQCGLLRQVYLSDLLDSEDLGLNARLARLVILARSRLRPRHAPWRPRARRPMIRWRRSI